MDHLDHIQSLLDLVKAFETVPHAILARCAIALGFPAALIRLSLAAYRLARALGIDGAYSKLIVATRGITAGAGFATVELELLLYDTIGYMHTRWATVLTIKVYVDDITLAACGLPANAIRTMVQALDYLVDRLENCLCMDVSQAKSKVLAGRPSVAAAVVQQLESGKLSHTRWAKMLGTDSVGGRRRSTVTFSGRVQSFAEKVPRIQALRKTGVNSLQMVRTAGTPAFFSAVTRLACRILPSTSPGQRLQLQPPLPLAARALSCYCTCSTALLARSTPPLKPMRRRF